MFDLQLELAHQTIRVTKDPGRNQKSDRKFGKLPRISKELPPNRADYSFGDLIYWHLFVFGTRPNGDPSARIGRLWDPKVLCEQVRITDRTLRNWIFDKHLPDDITAIEAKLFGDNRLFDEWRFELAEALRAARHRKSRKAEKILETEGSSKAFPYISDASPGNHPVAGSEEQPEPNTDDFGQETDGDQDGVINGDPGPETAERAPVDSTAPEEPVIEPVDDSSRDQPSRVSPHGHADPESEPQSGPDDANSGQSADTDREPEKPQTDAEDTGLGREVEPNPNPGEGQKGQPKPGAIVPVSSAPPRNPHRQKIMITVVTGAVAVIGMYIWSLKPPEQKQAAGVSTPVLPPPSAGEPPASGEQRPKRPQAPVTPPPANTVPNEEVRAPVPPKVQEPPAKPDDQDRAAKAAQAQRDAEERRKREEQKAAQEKRDPEQKTAQPPSQPNGTDDVAQPQQKGASGVAGQQEQERIAREVAELGYELHENTSARGNITNKLQLDSVIDCAQACARFQCETFAFKKESDPPHDCYQFKGPVTLLPSPKYSAGTRTVQVRPPEIQTGPGPTKPAAPPPNPPAAQKPKPPQNSSSSCEALSAAVSGFEISCDSILDGGTTLGSTQLAYTVSSVQECASKCRPVARCVGFTFNAAAAPGQRRCVIFGPNPEERASKGWITGRR